MRDVPPGGQPSHRLRQSGPSGRAGWRPRAVLALTLLAAAAGPGASRAVFAQQPGAPAPPPSFRSNTALLRVDAAVLDSRNQPVPGLRPDDFRVEIDGTPRRVLFAEAPAPSAPGPAASSYFVNTRRTGGRAVAVVVDLESVAPGAERPLLETAARFVEALPDTDPVVVVPMPGASLPLTRDHRLAAARIRALRGASQAPSPRHAFTFEEALAYERGDRRTIDEVIERECPSDVEAARTGIGRPPLCPSELVREARDRLSSERRHVEFVLTGLIRVARMLRDLETPATLVLIAGGLGFDPASLARYQEAARDVSAAGIMMYSVHAAPADADASVGRLAQSAAMRDRHAGLANLATMSGGVFLEGIARGTGVFERMRAEIVESYTLGIEAAPGDLDGRPHTVRVSTTRAGLTVRARPLVRMPSAGGEPEALLARLMQQGLDVPDLPLALATQTVRGEEAATVKVDLRLDVGRGSPGRAPVRYAAAILGRTGERLLETGGMAEEAGAGATVRLTAQLAPGPYRLRFAAVDADRRAGALDVPFVAGLRTVAGLQASDVIVGGATPAPALHVDAGAGLEAALELTTAAVDRFARTAVAFELRGASLPAPVLVEAPLQPTDFERQRIARAAVVTTGLPPGEYTLSAIVTADGVPAGRIPRHVVIVPPGRAAAPAPARPADARGGGAAADEGAPSTDPRLRELLPMLGRYVDAYGEDTAAIVGVEKYIQYPDGRGKPLEVLSELAMVRSGANWLGYRDVFQVGGDRVPDRRDRLMRILETSSDPVTEAARITAENARFNVGPVTRNFNVPATALLFFTTANLRRFTFTWKGRGRVEGTEAVEIAFRETAVPTLVRTRAGGNVPASGSLWVSPADGAVVRTRLRLEHFADAVAMPDLRAPAVPPPQPAPPPPPPAPAAPAPAPPPGGSQGAAPSAPAGTASGSVSSGGYTTPSPARPAVNPFADQAFTELRSRADIEVTFARHPQFRMWLPARMEEEYEGPLRRVNAPPVQGLSRARATYAEYKRFESGARIVGVAK